MTTEQKNQKVERLTEIKEQIKELMDEALSLVSDTKERTYAEGYWYAHIVKSLDSDNYYSGRSVGTMQNTVDAIENYDTYSGSDEEDEDDDETVCPCCFGDGCYECCGIGTVDSNTASKLVSQLEK